VGDDVGVTTAVGDGVGGVAVGITSGVGVAAGALPHAAAISSTVTNIARM
jgi:hypothetical protein